MNNDNNVNNDASEYGDAVAERTLPSDKEKKPIAICRDGSPEMWVRIEKTLLYPVLEPRAEGILRFSTESHATIETNNLINAYASWFARKHKVSKIYVKAEHIEYIRNGSSQLRAVEIKLVLHIPEERSADVPETL